MAQFYKGLKDRVKDNIARVNRPSQLQSMITLAIWIDDQQYERELEKKDTYNYGKKNRYQKSPKKDQYGMVPMELDATEKRNQLPWKKTRKCYNCGKISHLAKACRGKKQANATQSKKKKEKKKREPKKDKQLNATQTKAKPDHATLSWTGCYDNDCYIHLSDKQGSEWFPKQPQGKQLNATGQQEGYDYNRLIKKPFLRRIDELQEEIDKLREECQEPFQDFATVKWETESLILSFREETFNIKELIPHHLEIQQKDTTLSKISEKKVSQWVDNHSIPSIRDMATQMDLEKTSSGQCPAKYWKTCQDNYCRQHLEEKQNQQWFPGTEAMELYRALHKQRTMKHRCNQDQWELCFVPWCQKHYDKQQAIGLDGSKN